MRYVEDSQYFTKPGPILLYCGNEADIFMFYNTSGFQTETLARHFKALVIFAEHRYFGESIPLSDPDRKYLSLENAMMDYLNLIKVVK